MLFFVTPIVSGLLIPLFLRGGNGQAVTVFNAFLTSFVPLFATILTFYMSWCYKKMKTRKGVMRLNLFRQTSTCILLMIPIAAVALVLQAASTSQVFSCVMLWEEKAIWGIDLPELLQKVTVNDVMRYILLSAYYGLIVEILLILFMVCKRANIIIKEEINMLIKEQEEAEAEELEE